MKIIFFSFFIFPIYFIHGLALCIARYHSVVDAHLSLENAAIFDQPLLLDETKMQHGHNGGSLFGTTFILLPIRAGVLAAIQREHRLKQLVFLLSFVLRLVHLLFHRVRVKAQLGQIFVFIVRPEEGNRRRNDIRIFDQFRSFRNWNVYFTRLNGVR